MTFNQKLYHYLYLYARFLYHPGHDLRGLTGTPRSAQDEPFFYINNKATRGEPYKNLGLGVLKLDRTAGVIRTY